MEYRVLGSSDLKVSALALGTMTFGEQNSEAEAHAQLDLAVSHGVNFIDTAEMYPVAPRAETVHRTESYIGTWLKHQPRDKLIVASKIAGPSRGFGWIRNGPHINREHISAAIEGSLRRLQTDYLDLYQIHWPDRYVPMFGCNQLRRDAGTRQHAHRGTTVRYWRELVKAGKIRHIGLSNETPWGVSEFVRCAEQLGLPKIVSIQNAYHLMNRTFESGLAETLPSRQGRLARLQPAGIRLAHRQVSRRPACERTHHAVPRLRTTLQQTQCSVCSRRVCEASPQKPGLTPATHGARFRPHSLVHQQRHPRRDYTGTTHGESEERRSHLTAELLEKIEAVHRKFPNPAP